MKKKGKKENSRLDLSISRKNIVKSKRSTRALMPISRKDLLASKRSQEEMVGFVLIIILVSVIVLVFLAISIRKPKEARESKEVENFLHSSLLYTTSCYESEEIVYDLKDLMKACYESKKCLNGEESCEVLNKTAFEVIEKSFQVGEEGVEKAYVFKVYSGEDVLVYLSKGKLTAIEKEAEIPIYVEEIKVNMKVSY